MPIYAYRCSACGHAKDVLQKMSDPVLHTCPVCGAETFTKQLTAAGFQLKGSGWYATDFKGSGVPPPAAGGEAAATGEPAKPADASAAPAPAATPAPAGKADGRGNGSGSSGGGGGNGGGGGGEAAASPGQGGGARA